MSDQDLPAALQEGLVNPLKAKLQKTDRRLTILTLLIVTNLAMTAALFSLLLRRG